MTTDPRAALVARCDRTRAKYKESPLFSAESYRRYSVYLEACAELYEYDHPTPEPVDDDPADPPGAR